MIFTHTKIMCVHAQLVIIIIISGAIRRKDGARENMIISIVYGCDQENSFFISYICSNNLAFTAERGTELEEKWPDNDI